MSEATVPRYRQLKELIIRRISTGELRPRDRVPSENELVDTTGVSRMTANRALRELTDEGYVERVAGVGTFVADYQAASHVLEVRNIADEIEHRGHQHTAEVLLADETAADANAADVLRCREGDRLLHVRLVHFESGAPVQLEDRYVLPGFAPDFLAQDFTATTPGAYLTSVSPLQEAEHVVRAAMPDDETRRKLDMERGEPCLVVTRRTWARGRPVTFARLCHPGSRFELSGHYAPPGADALVME
ncbi:MAG: histidine utilization repressor [Gammaproteobacteria bacterium]|nr:histidine utilization repressor [Gammaproteobacteria bacterium]